MTDENTGAPTPAAETPAQALTQPPAPAQTTVYVLAPKETGIAYACMLFVFLGAAGIQHFYLGKVGRGILWLLTWGLFGIGTIIDLFTLPSQTRAVNARRATGIR